MIDFLLTPANTPFVVALGIMLALAVIEVLSVSLGMGLSEMLDSLVPDMDVDVDIDVDVEGDVSAVGGPVDSLMKVLAWLRIGEVPVVMLLVVFLTGFGLSGLVLQYVVNALIGKTLPGGLAVIPAMFVAVPMVRYFGGLLGKYMPQDETYAVSEGSFPGMVATVTMGVAKVGKPAQAKLKDKHGQTHYILVEPDNPGETFSQGDKTIIVSQNGAVYKVIDISSSAMVD